MEAGDRIWQEAAAGVQSSVDADLREEAYEIFVAEAARCRLVDRVGRTRVALRCGVSLEGELAPEYDDAIDAHLMLLGVDGGSRLIPVDAIVSLTGSRPGLRPEADRIPRSLASWLREAWAADEPIRLLDGSGRWVAGHLDYVGADHVELMHEDGCFVVPVRSVEAWQLG
jgi:hypothetical protein